MVVVHRESERERERKLSVYMHYARLNEKCNTHTYPFLPLRSIMPIHAAPSTWGRRRRRRRIKRGRRELTWS